MLIYDFNLYPPVDPNFSMQFKLKFAFEHSVNPLLDVDQELHTLEEIITSALFVPYQQHYQNFIHLIMGEIQAQSHLTKPLEFVATIKPHNDIIEYYINS